MNLSVCILTKNAEKTIEKALQSVKTFNEIIIIDDYSDDKTLNIVKKFKAKVYKRKLNNDFSSQRNFALSKAKNDWVLFLDSDEYLSKDLIKELKSLKEPRVDGFFINRQEKWLGKRLTGGEWGNNYLLRLGKKKSGLWSRKVHEVWQIDNTAKLTAKIIHQPDKSIFEMVDKIKRYSRLHSSENRYENKNADILSVIFRPPLKFVYNFILKSGYKDGTYGFVYSVMMSFHSFLSWSDLWIKQRKK